MSKVIETLPGRSGRSEKYPWDEWLDGQVRELEPGKDFSGKPASLRTQASAKARARDKRAETRIVDGKFYLQAVELTEAEKNGTSKRGRPRKNAAKK